MTDEEDYQARMAMKADLDAWVAELKAADAARRAAARARGEPLYPDPGFKASRLIEPTGPFEDFGYLTDADLRQFMKAAQVAQSRRSVLDTRSLVAADEPAHVYRLG
jgi:hypothetical protein